MVPPSLPDRARRSSATIRSLASTPARRALLLKAADLLENRTAEFSALMLTEIGATAPWAGFNVHCAADILREAAALTVSKRQHAGDPGIYRSALDHPRRAAGLPVLIAIESPHTESIIMKIPGPDHPITVTPVMEPVTVSFHGTVIAETHHALELREASYPPVFYIPRNDAKMAHFVRSQHETGCPYKGMAAYFSLTSPAGTAENAVWTYEEPYPAVAAIKGHLAFYPEHVTIRRG